MDQPLGKHFNCGDSLLFSSESVLLSFWLSSRSDLGLILRLLMELVMLLSNFFLFLFFNGTEIKMSFVFVWMESDVGRIIRADLGS